MKLRLISFTAFVCFVFATTAAAQLVAYESFSGLPVGPGVPGTGTDSFGWATGWQGAGTTDAHFQIVAPAPALSYQISNGGLLPGGSRALLLTTAPEPLASTVMLTRDLPAINTTYYVSFLFRMPVAGAGTDSIDVHIMNGATTTSRLAFRPNAGGTGPFMRLLDGATDETGSSSTLAGDTLTIHLIVIQVIAVSSPANYLVRAFVDPAADYAAPSGVFFVRSGPFHRLGFGIRSTDTSGPSTSVLLDEIRVGFRWEDVVIPKPILGYIAPAETLPALRFRWSGKQGNTYQMQSSANLSQWQDFAGNYMGGDFAGGDKLLELFDAVTVGSPRFYRLKIQ